MACLSGAMLRHKDEMGYAVHAGYYSGYYTNGKRPKSPQHVLNKLFGSQKERAKEVDVETYENRDARRRELQKNGRVRKRK